MATLKRTTALTLVGEIDEVIGHTAAGATVRAKAVDLPVPDHTHAVVDITGLAAVATSGSYADLSGAPTLFDGAWSSLTGVPATFAPSAHTHPAGEVTGLATVATTGAYADLSGRPTLATVATSGAYADLTGAPALTAGLSIVIDGGGSAIADGAAGDIEVPFACTITAVRAFADAAGDASIDILRAASGVYPPVASITGGSPLVLAAAASGTASLSGWTTTLAAGDVLRPVLSGVATVERLTISLTLARS